MLPEMLEVLHELVDAVAALKGITGNRQSELHELVEKVPAALEHMVSQHAGQPAGVSNPPVTNSPPGGKNVTADGPADGAA
jgi:hypothetical protein